MSYIADSGTMKHMPVPIPILIFKSWSTVCTRRGSGANHVSGMMCLILSGFKIPENEVMIPCLLQKVQLWKFIRANIFMHDATYALIASF